MHLEIEEEVWARRTSLVHSATARWSLWKPGDHRLWSQSFQWHDRDKVRLWCVKEKTSITEIAMVSVAYSKYSDRRGKGQRRQSWGKRTDTLIRLSFWCFDHPIPPACSPPLASAVCLPLFLLWFSLCLLRKGSGYSNFLFGLCSLISWTKVEKPRLASKTRQGLALVC